MRESLWCHLRQTLLKALGGNPNASTPLPLGSSGGSGGSGNTVQPSASGRGKGGRGKGKGGGKAGSKAGGKAAGGKAAGKSKSKKRAAGEDDGSDGSKKQKTSEESSKKEEIMNKLKKLTQGGLIQDDDDDDDMADEAEEWIRSAGEVALSLTVGRWRKSKRMELYWISKDLNEMHADIRDCSFQFCFWLHLGSHRIVSKDLWVCQHPWFWDKPAVESLIPRYVARGISLTWKNCQVFDFGTTVGKFCVQVILNSTFWFETTATCLTWFWLFPHLSWIQGDSNFGGWPTVPFLNPWIAFPAVVVGVPAVPAGWCLSGDWLISLLSVVQKINWPENSGDASENRSSTERSDVRHCQTERKCRHHHGVFDVLGHHLGIHLDQSLHLEGHHLGILSILQRPKAGTSSTWKFGPESSAGSLSPFLQPLPAQCHIVTA